MSSVQGQAVQAQLCYTQYQQAATLTEQQTWLEELLVQHATPLIRAIVNQKLRAEAAAQHSLDLQQQIQMRLLTRLRGPADEAPVQDFLGYVAALAYNSCADWQRQCQPQRHALKNRVRYLLTHTPGLALWEAQPRLWWGGQSGWQQHTLAANVAQLEDCRRALPPGQKLRELLVGIFARLRRPAELDDLVNLLAAHLLIHDDRVALATEELADPSPHLTTTVERRAYLRKLWAEIKQLPQNQRNALLLNLRNPAGGNQLALFHLTGVAGLPELAQVLGLSLEALAEVWNRLPLDDLTLAAQLGVTRQQVINLRLAARRRLARRLGEF